MREIVYRCTRCGATERHPEYRPALTLEYFHDCGDGAQGTMKRDHVEAKAPKDVGGMR